MVKVKYNTGGKIRAIGRKILSRKTRDKITYAKALLDDYEYRVYNKFVYKNWDFFNSVLIETSTYCNRKCAYCPNSIYDRGSIKKNKLMPIKLYKHIINELVRINFKGLVKPFNYNEPLLDKRIYDIISYTKKKLPKCTLMIATNGDYLTIENYNKLVNAGIGYIGITTHLPKIPEHIKELFKYIKKTKQKVKIDYNYITEETQLANRGGLVKVKNRSRIPRCMLAPITFNINYNGNIFLCCNDYFGKYTFGNIKYKKIEDIWFSDKYKNIRNELRNKEYKYEICKRCML